MRNTFINTIINACKIRGDIFIISGDAGLGVFDEFKILYPDIFLNLGVAEQNMTSFSAGLSMAGFKVYLYNIVTFLLYRCYEQVRNDICYQVLPVTLVGIGSGITYAPQGMTHYSVEDIGLAQTLPNLTVISPIDPVEAELAAEYSLNAKEPVYIRLAKRGEPAIHSRKDFDITVPQVVREGSDIAILFHGSISNDVMDAYNKLSKENISPMLVSVPVIQPLNKECLFAVLKGMKYVVFVEEHFENTGLGSILMRFYCECKPSWKIKTMGIPYRFIHEIKDTVNMRRLFGISSEGIVKVVKDMLEV
ncbi:MAG: transketolase [Planctomycetes bacterium]|nr:transketolase [Planctomycetota bacterium]